MKKFKSNWEKRTIEVLNQIENKIVLDSDLFSKTLFLLLSRGIYTTQTINGKFRILRSIYNITILLVKTKIFEKALIGRVFNLLRATTRI